MARPGGAALCVRCGDRLDKHYYGQECRATDQDGRCPCPGFLSVQAARRIHENRQQTGAATWKR